MYSGLSSEKVRAEREEAPRIVAKNPLDKLDCKRMRMDEVTSVYFYSDNVLCNAKRISVCL
jgi:hypothetical protein